MPTRVDVHVHSKYSDRPSDWLLRRIGAPESFVEPRHIYDTAMERGMNFVTISDHNCISGALEIAHLPGTFLSTEVTTYFPEDGCKIHCLALGITEPQFEIIQEIRPNIYEFQQYLLEQNIVYSVAHPLFQVNDRLTVDHIEKLIVLFNRFEIINGMRDSRASKVIKSVLTSITPEMIEILANRHDLSPVGDQPWKKTFTAGSDDHSGVYVACAHTTTPDASSVDEFLDHLRSGDHTPEGESGTSLRLAHSLYHIGYGYYKQRFLAGDDLRTDLVNQLFRHLLGNSFSSGNGSSESTDNGSVEFGMMEKLWQFIGGFARSRQLANLNEVERNLVDEFRELFAEEKRTQEAAEDASPDRDCDRRTFRIACRISEQLGCTFLQRFMGYMREGRLLEAIQSLCSLGPVALSMAPYLTAFHTQHKDESLIQEVAGHFSAAGGMRLRSKKKAWVTDTFDDVNGVARTIQSMSAAAAQIGRELTVVTCLEESPEVDFPLKNFKPVGRFDLPEYESQSLFFPPLLELLEYLEREKFSEIVISTPGPLGLCALAAGRMLGIQVSGVYHTDFPFYVLRFTEDERMEKITRQYMHWFYGQLDHVLAPSQFYLKELVDQGLDASKLSVMERGVDVKKFHPNRRDPEFWEGYGATGKTKFLYVGRVSKEKDLDVLAEGFEELLKQGHDANLIVVGDGPFLQELQERYSRPEIIYTGYLHGEPLLKAYASADVFVFPSTSDTFGNAVLEAQAAGLPAIVTAFGGPPEIVARCGSGIVIEDHQPCSWTETMAQFCTQSDLRETLSKLALENAQQRSWQNVVETLWQSQPTKRVLPPSYRRSATWVGKSLTSA